MVSEAGARSDQIGTKLWIPALTRFVYANRPSPAEAGYGRRRLVSTSLENALSGDEAAEIDGPDPVSLRIDH